MKTSFKYLLLSIGIIYSCWSAQSQTLTDHCKIWDKAPHAAFTGLIDYRDTLYCCFREANSHVPKRTGVDDGKIRILASRDGKHWTPSEVIELQGVDLRDPELVETPDGQLMLIMGGSRYVAGKFLGSVSHVAFRDRQTGHFTTPAPIEMDQADFSGQTWLWRVRWHNDTAYGIAYAPGQIALVKTTDGIRYELVHRFDLEGQPNETDLLFDSDNRLTLVVRCENAHGKLGYSNYPYTQWTWRDAGVGLGGPRIIRLPDGRMLVGSREYADDGPYFSLFEADLEQGMNKIIRLPSGGDCSYPGMVVRNNKLYVSYYSQHENYRASIYMATFDLP